MSFVVTHATGSRTFDAYSLDEERVSYAFSSEPNALPGTPTIKWGDRLPNPSPYGVRAWVDGDSLAAASSLAYAIVAECETATLVESYDGARAVDGILGYRVIPAPDFGPVALLHLEFAPTSRAVPRVAYVTRSTPNASDDDVIAFLRESGYVVTHHPGPDDLPDLDSMDVIYVSDWATSSGLAKWVTTRVPLVLAHAGVAVEAGMSSVNKTNVSYVSIDMLTTHVVTSVEGAGNVAIHSEPRSVPFLDPADLIGNFAHHARAPDTATRAFLVAGSVAGVRKVLVPIGSDSAEVWFPRLRSILLASVAWVLS